jgi:putative transposase
MTLLFTPKALHSSAQGRAAHPGSAGVRVAPTPKALHKGYCDHPIEDLTMPQSLAKIYVHLVFSTKHRQPFLTDKQIRNDCHAYLAGTCKQRGSVSLLVGGVEDHVHILCTLSREEAVAVLVRELKRESSKWLKEKSAALRDFYWQAGYGVFSVSPAHVEALKRYIADQEAHHRRESFQEEYRRLLGKYGVVFDERYVWD